MPETSIERIAIIKLRHYATSKYSLTTSWRGLARSYWTGGLSPQVYLHIDFPVYENLVPDCRSLLVQFSTNYKGYSMLGKSPYKYCGRALAQVVSRVIT